MGPRSIRSAKHPRGEGPQRIQETRPGSRAWIQPRFRIHTHKPPFEQEALGISGLDGFHRVKKGRKTGAINQLNAWHFFHDGQAMIAKAWLQKKGIR